MQTKDLQSLALKVLDDLQAIDTTVIDVRPLTTVTDLMIICSGRSNRHLKSIADKLVAAATEEKVSYCHLEGDEISEWVLVDLGDIVVHLMMPATRELYDLEGLWEPFEELPLQDVNQR